jgi:chemotaxis protein MotB
MPTGKILIAAGLALLLLSACEVLSPYHEMKNDLETSRSEQDKMETRLKQAEDNNNWLETELRNCKASRDQFLKESTDLRAQISYLKKINQQLLENSKRLKLELSKKKSVIQLQGKVIQLLDDTKKTIETSLKDQIAAQKIEVVEEDDKLKVIFIDKILFDSGSATINERGMELMQILAGSLKGNKDQSIVVEGHTDNVPVSTLLQKRFPSNWELSTARAAAVVRFFQEQGGIDPQRLSASGFSFYRPVVPNTSEEGRHQNRRIEIILGVDQ